MKKIIAFLVACLLSGFLIISIPLLNVWLKGGGEAKTEQRKTAVTVKKLQQKKKEPKKKPTRRPKRSKSRQRNVKAGPRFAMDLGVAGLGGVSLPSDLVNRSRGNGGDVAGDVDDRPELNGGINFELPSAIKDAEVNASVVMMFCVDVSGTPYDIRIMKESPAGMGLAEAGKAALKSSSFSPAIKDGNPVAFCGMEQPIEVRFKD